MDLLILDTSKYDDPLSEVWHASPRYTASFLRRRGVDAAVTFMPVLREGVPAPRTSPLALYFEVSDDNVAPSLDFLPGWRRSLPETRILVGGTTASLMADALLRTHPEIDAVVVGECDETLADTVAQIKAHRPMTQVAGLRVRNGRFQPRTPLRDLDDLGMMARDGLDALFERTPAAERVAYLLAGRGCYADCSFCSVPAFARQSSPRARWRARSVGLIVDEMESFTQTSGVRRFVFQDDNFFGPGQSGQARARELAAEILDRRLKLEYFVTCRVNDVDAPTLRAMKASGLCRLGVGVESLNQRSLSLFSKGYRAEAIYPALEVVNELGIACEVNLIFFEPTMTVADVRLNLDFVEHLAKREWIGYSDGFPFKALHVAPWSPVAARLAELDALEPDRLTLRFQDRRVGALARFADELHACMPRVFKRRSFVEFGDDRRGTGVSTETARTCARWTNQLRMWLGLTLVPQYLRAACQIVEDHADDFEADLARLAANFDAKMEVVRRFGGRLAEIGLEGAKALD